jgi:hypothetical protein
MTTFNEFQAILNRMDLPKEHAYVFTLLFERQTELAKQMDSASKVLVALADSVANFVELHERTQQGLTQLMRGGRPDGVDVYTESVLDDPTKDK